MDPELERILANVQYMISEGAPETDLSAYLKDEGYTLASLDEAVGEHAAEMRLATGGGNAVTDFLHQAAEGATLGQAEKAAGVGLRGLLDMATSGSPAAAMGRGVARATSPEGQARSASFQQRTDDLQRLAPGASMAAHAAPFANTGVALAAGLGPAVNAIRGVAGGVARSPLSRRIMSDWLPKGGAGYLLFDKIFGGK